MYFVLVLNSMFVSRLLSFLLGSLMYLEFTWRGPEGRVRHPFITHLQQQHIQLHCFFEGLRKIQQRCLSLDEQSIPLKSSCDINSKNLLERKVIFEDGVEVVRVKSSKNVSANTDIYTVSKCMKVGGFLNIKSVAINIHFSTFYSSSLHNFKMTKLQC